MLIKNASTEERIGGVLTSLAFTKKRGGKDRFRALQFHQTKKRGGRNIAKGLASNPLLIRKKREKERKKGGKTGPSMLARHLNSFVAPLKRGEGGKGPD